jgi:hypothetical protein
LACKGLRSGGSEQADTLFHNNPGGLATG